MTQFHTRCLFSVFFVITTGCSFDTSSDGQESIPDSDNTGPVNPVPIPVPVPISPPEAPPLPVFGAVSDETRRGNVLDGSYLDTRAADGETQLIDSEIDKNRRRLDQRWQLEEVPTGVPLFLELALEVDTDDEEILTVDYGAGKGAVTLFELSDSGDDGITVYQAAIAPLSDSTVLVRIRGDTVDDEIDMSISVDLLRVTVAD